MVVRVGVATAAAADDVGVPPAVAAAAVDFRGTVPVGLGLLGGAARGGTVVAAGVGGFLGGGGAWCVAFGALAVGFAVGCPAAQSARKAPRELFFPATS